MAAKQKVTRVTRTVTRTRTKKNSSKKGERRRCPVCGKYY